MSKIPILEIAIGSSRYETKWKNKKVSWPSLVEKLSKTHRTHETFTFYQKADRKQRDKIKDIGGFVGGYIIGGNRKSGAVAYRTVLTLDVDEAKPGFWKLFQLLYGNAACCYSTHSHEPDKPRYRLLLPFNRQVTPEEYQPVARRVAGDLGIEQFDNTGFQDERLMYWPSTAQDGVYEFYSQDGPALDVEEVLETYTNWRDASEWPVSERVSELIKRSQKKQGDPLDKKGIVGAFCRTYTISQAIEKYLADVYDPTDKEDRYTYVHSTTAAGLIVYDDKWAFSHHGTDPISGKLCNAFDLVRLHLYGDDDKLASPETAPEKLPSYQAMKELAGKDTELRKQIGVEKLEAAREEFEGLGFDIAELDTKWLEGLEVDSDSKYKATINNIVLILENDPVLRGAIAYDAFSNVKIINRQLPWRKPTDTSEWEDNDDANLRHYIEQVYAIKGTKVIEDALQVVLKRHSFHPVRDYLATLEWDGVARIDELLIKHFHAVDNPYVRAVTRKALTAAVARVYEPGCKFDYMLVLRGPQGFKKSMFIDILGGDWYSDTFTTMQGREAYEQLQGNWLIEVAELAGMRKAEVETVKLFVAKRRDKFRVAYGHNPKRFPRQCIFIGTTNKDAFLIDPTGGRRFWPVEVRARMTDEEELRNNRNQIWAEAVHLYKGREPLYLDRELEKHAEQVQREHTETDDRQHLIATYLEKLLPEDWESMSIWDRREFINGNGEALQPGVEKRQFVTALDVWLELFGGASKDYTLRIAREINDMLRQFNNWEYKETRDKKNWHKKVMGFVRKVEIEKFDFLA